MEGEKAISPSAAVTLQRGRDGYNRFLVGLVQSNTAQSPLPHYAGPVADQLDL